MVYLCVQQFSPFQVVHVNVAGLEIAGEDFLVDSATNRPQPDRVEHAAQDGSAGLDRRHDVVGVNLVES